MKISLAEMSRIYQDYLRHETPAAGGECPALERIVRCTMAKVPRRERSEIVDHASNCLRCAAALKDVLDVSRAADGFAEKIASSRKEGPVSGSAERKPFRALSLRRPAVAVPAGMLAVAIVALAVFSLRDRPAMRGGPATGVRLVAPVKAPVAGSDVLFRWQGPDGADHYTVELFDAALGLVWRSGPVGTGEVRLPEEVSRSLVPESPYFWAVTAVLKNRAEAKSALAQFSVTK